MDKIRFTQNTYIKVSAQQSSILAEHQKVLLPKDTVLNIHSYAQDPHTQHMVVTFGKDNNGAQIHFNGLTRWFVFRPHVLVFNDKGEVLTGVSKELQDNETIKPQFKGKKIQIIGGGSVYLDQPVIEGGCVTWGEATHGGERLFQTKDHVLNFLTLCTRVQIYRDKIGKPFIITSCYRPEPWNSRVGGARQSRHLTGKAIDFYVQGWNNQQLYNHFRDWNGGVGTYSYDNYIIHLDIDTKRRWGVCS